MSAKSMYRTDADAELKRARKRARKVAVAKLRGFGGPLKQYGWQLLKERQRLALLAQVGAVRRVSEREYRNEVFGEFAVGVGR